MEKSADDLPIIKIIGVVADVKLQNENKHGSSKCSVFGLNQTEYDAISEKYPIVPKTYSEDHTDRYLVHCSPWQAMRILGENFGYALTVTPLHSKIKGASGDRSTTIWTMVSSSKRFKPNPF